MRRPQRSDFHKPVRQRPREAEIYRFPKRLIVLDSDRAAQQQADKLIRAANGVCPCCRINALSIQARYGKTTFRCHACGADHDRIASRLRKLGVLEKPAKQPREKKPPNWREIRWPNG